ncbi:MAG: FtsX-like permease family protein [Christensenellales bacterium]
MGITAWLLKRNFKKDVVQMAVIVCCVGLVCTMIIILGNLGYYTGVNADDIILQQSKIGEEIWINPDGDKIRERDGIPKDKPMEFYLTTQQAESVVNRLHQEYDNLEYDFSTGQGGHSWGEGKYAWLKAYCAYGMPKTYSDTFDIGFETIAGEELDEDADGKDYIWLAENAGEDFAVGDSIDVNGKIYLVKGVVKGRCSYVDYRNFDDIMRINIVNRDGYDDISEVKRLSALLEEWTIEYGKIDDNPLVIGSDAVSSYALLHKFRLGVDGIYSFLIAIGMLLNLVGMVNSIKLNFLANRRSWGLLKAMGLKAKNIWLYYMAVWSVYVVSGAIIATIVSAVVLRFCMGTVLTAVFECVYYYSDDMITGFNALFSLVAMAVTEIECALLAWRASERISKTDATLLIRGEV